MGMVAETGGLKELARRFASLFRRLPGRLNSWSGTRYSVLPTLLAGVLGEVRSTSTCFIEHRFG